MFKEFGSDCFLALKHALDKYGKPAVPKILFYCILLVLVCVCFRAIFL